MNSTTNITVHVPGPLRAYCGGASTLPVSARTVHGVLDALARDHAALYSNICDETGKLRRHLNVYVNADHMRELDGLDTVLKSGDVVTVLPAVSGG